MVLSVLFLLNACAASTPSPTKVVLPELPKELRVCPGLQTVSDRVGDLKEVGDDKIKVMWAQDRAVAVKCIRRHNALVKYYDDLRASLADEPDR